MRARWSLFVALLSEVGCSSTTGVNELPLTVELRSGNRVVLVNQSITLQYDSLVSDSRCPIGALCIVAGRAVLGFSLSGPQLPSGRVLQLATDHPDSSLGVVLTAESVTPFPQLNRPAPDHRGYLVRLRITAP